MTDLHVVEICAGAGGQSLGLHLAGFHHKLAVELDLTAAATLSRNLERLDRQEGRQGPDRSQVAVGDVADADVWTPRKYEGVDLLAGGVPCPPFSDAGLQKGALDERDLFAWAVEQVGIMQPRALLLENVRGLSRPRFAGYRQHVADRLAEFGYWSEWRLLHASDYGVPQLRPRFVLVAMRAADAAFFSWPTPSPTKATVGSTLRAAMGSRGWAGAAAWARRANDIAPTIVGGSKKHGGADLGPTRAKQAWAAMGVNGKGVADEPPGPDFADPRGPMLTTEMVAKLQGWNGREYRWEFEGLKTSRYRQIGNAFPPPVARALGTSINRALRHEGQRRTDHLATDHDHDEVYRALRAVDGYVSEDELIARLEASITREELHAKVRALSLDFELEIRTERGQLKYALGRFKAFRGEQGHDRHIAFSSVATRGRIS